MAKAKTSANGVLTELGDPTDGGNETISMTEPYVATVKVKGVASILFHRWNNEAVEQKAKAAKGSDAKKTENVESYVYRNDEQELCIPGEYLRQAIIKASKFRQDPRSPRKSAMDLYKAVVISLTELATLGVKDWDYLDRRRVVIQGNSITRTRPAMKAGWEAEFQLLVNMPEYIPPHILNEVIAQAGRLIGLGDFRPSHGRFQVVSFVTGLDG